jgi:hypothetical protein
LGLLPGFRISLTDDHQCVSGLFLLASALALAALVPVLLMRRRPV